MSHWLDPTARGVYRHPSAIPPAPSHRAANDLASRLSRVEEHLQFSSWNQGRIEDESRRRARDLGEGMDAMTERQDEMDGRLRSLEQDRHTRKHIWGLVTILATSGGAFVRYLIAAFLVLAMLTGNADVRTAQKLLGIPHENPH